MKTSEILFGFILILAIVLSYGFVNFIENLP